MAWMLKNSSSANASIVIPTLTISSAVGNYIEIKAQANSDAPASQWFRLAGTTSGYSNLIEVQDTGVLVRVSSAGSVLSSGFVKPAPGEIFTIRVVRESGNVVAVFLNGVRLGDYWQSANMTLSCFFNLNSDPTGAFLGSIYYVAVSTNGGASATRYYDPSASGGAGTILPDTVNSANNGTQAGTWPSDNSEWVFYSSGATYQLTAQGGAFSYSGGSAALNRGYKLAAQGATYTYTGASASLTYNTAVVYRMDALGTSYSYAGASASLLRGFRLSANGGTYSYSGADAVLRRGFKLAASGGVFNYAGADASLTYVAGPTVYRLTALGVTYVYSGGNATLTATGVIPAANPAAFVNRAYVSGNQVISAQVGGRLVNNAKIGGSLTNNATVAI